VKLKKKTQKPSRLGKKPKKTKKKQKKTKKNKKKQKNPLGWVFLKKPGFFPTLHEIDLIFISRPLCPEVSLLAVRKVDTAKVCFK
jgi:hypothetical protein